ncbi:MAG: RIP metalloprotease RseP [Limnospira sp. PMC 1291.21]|uniref:Zinc metalloprotease n=3 Tax=Limnospira TaxID=2596745 RepID=A0A9P1NY22_9CYAN|nr:MULTISPECIES: RIP metalloprotease RseP [Limnospira]MBD2670665.1 RIP metalloprotease RseP [Arthrospira platensis FACHB-439]MDC0836900.1 RIP metalloprotease RseP [Limnoraphis robusta]MDY7053788.1 RIP metalloprotease RseP [Limnospira fusiformis LS22]QJB27289.1 RIP metalloprotease RseP [Limnospira fusiformis SAG 85.79]UWU49600.1 RIP metalloprotease RseP [Arthrospira platensis C1]
MSVLAAIAVLGILIVVHELGHFMAARLQHIHVNRFSIGFGPVLWKYQGPETEYALRGFPLGGFVGFPDEDPDSEIPKDDPNLLSNRPILDRAIVISAGVIANLIFAYLLLVVQVGMIGVPDFDYQPGVRVPSVASDVSSAAAKAGIEDNDLIISVNGEELGAESKSITRLIEVIQSNPNQPLKMEVQRGDRIIPVEVTPEPGSDGKGRIGVQLSPNGQIVRYQADGIIDAFVKGAEEFQRIFNLTLAGFSQLINNFRETAPQLSGPVAIVAIGANIARSDASNLFQFAALISINLAIINILPLPALDGGQLAFLLIEALRGKPLPQRVQESVMQTGLMLLLGLGIFLIIRDTANLTDLSWVRSLLQ